MNLLYNMQIIILKFLQKYIFQPQNRLKICTEIGFPELNAIDFFVFSV